MFIVIFRGRNIRELMVFIAGAAGHLQPGITCQISVNRQRSSGTNDVSGSLFMDPISLPIGTF